MHRQFRKLLDNATGSSEFAVVASVDTRGFTAFSRQVESPEVAMFMKRVYMKLIDKYYSTATYYKATGDGLLCILPYSERTLTEVVQRAVSSSLEVVDEFGSFCNSDPIINFTVPTQVGIGLSRGTICRLASGKTAIDYSGHVLNMASRLTDLAEPSGIVFDRAFGLELLEPTIQTRFSKESVYIKGIADSEPVEVYYLKDYTNISAHFKRPIVDLLWHTIAEETTLKSIRQRGPVYFIQLEYPPLDPSKIRMEVSYPAVISGKKSREMRTYINFDEFEYSVNADSHEVTIQYDALAKLLEENGVKDSWNVKIKIQYPRR